MIKLLLVFGGITQIISVFGQNLSPQVIASSGNSFSNTNAGIEFTIGEGTTSTMTTSGSTLTQGFHQPEIHFASFENYNDDYVFTLYPNPTEQFLTVMSTNREDMLLHIYDVNGRAVIVSPVFQEQILLDLQALASGSYILQINTRQGLPLHNYTIIKKSIY